MAFDRDVALVSSQTVSLLSVTLYGKLPMTMASAHSLRNTISTAAAVVEVACDVMLDMPSLLLAPVVKASS